MEPGRPAAASSGAVRAATVPAVARGVCRRPADEGRTACARNASGAGAGALPDAGNDTVDTTTSERAVAGAATVGAIGRRPRMAIPAPAVGRSNSVVVAAGAGVAGGDAVLTVAPAGACGGLSVVSVGGTSVVSEGGGAGGGLAGGTGSITVTVVWLVASCTCVAS